MQNDGCNYGAGGAMLSCRKELHGMCCRDVPEAAPTHRDALRPPDDPISPEHYARLDPEPIDVIRAWGLDYCRGCAVKYIARAGHKGDAAEDLRKAIRYLEYALGEVSR